MLKVLFVAAELGYTGASKQLTLVSLGLPRDRFEVCVCVLGPEGPWADTLRSAGVRVEALGWKRGLNLGALVQLRRLVSRFQPAMIHAWRPWAWRALTLATGRLDRPLVVSQALVPRQRGPRLGWLDRWLLGRADRIVAAGPGEAERCQRLGVSDAKIAVIPPGVELLPDGREEETEIPLSGTACLSTELRHLLAGRRFLLCAGPLAPHKGFHDAVWSFDPLRRLYPELCLLLLGAGPDRPRLERFAECTRMQHCVHFAGTQDDLAGAFARAEVVWIPSRAEGGVNVALEAMAAGKPVVASRLPGLAEVVAQGETGFLIAPGDRVALSRHTRLLLDDEACRQRLGAAGRRRVQLHFGAAHVVQRFADLYCELAA